LKKSKDKFYRGINVEELKRMDTREFAKLVRARERRSILRNYDIIEAFVKRCLEKDAKKKMIKTHNRSLVIVPALLGKVIGIYNGKEFLRVEITDQMLGHRLGEFSLTRKLTKHSKAGVGATKGSRSKSVK